MKIDGRVCIAFRAFFISWLFLRFFCFTIYYASALSLHNIESTDFMKSLLTLWCYLNVGDYRESISKWFDLPLDVILPHAVGATVHALPQGGGTEWRGATPCLPLLIREFKRSPLMVLIVPVTFAIYSLFQICTRW